MNFDHVSSARYGEGFAYEQASKFLHFSLNADLIPKSKENLKTVLLPSVAVFRD